MNRIFNRKLPFILILLAFLMLPSISRAGTLLQQITASSTDTYVLGNFDNLRKRFQTIYLFNAGEIDTIKSWLAIYSGGGSFRACIYNTDDLISIPTGSPKVCSATTTFPQSGDSEKSFSVATTTLSQGIYAISLEWLAGNSAEVWGSGTDKITGQCFRENGDDCWLADIYFVLKGQNFGLTETTLMPVKPKDCQVNLVDYDSIELEGSLKIPDNDINHYLRFWVIFDDIDSTVNNKWFDFDLGYLGAGEIFNYSTTTTTTDSTAFKVSYKIEGVNPLGYWVSYYHYCSETYITETIPFIPEAMTPITGYGLPEEEDCLEMGLTDRLLCEIKNLFQGIFLPSQSKVKELSQNVDLIKDKFPSNYLKSAFNFISNVRAGINSSSTISFKILGQSGYVDFNFWEQTASVSGTLQTLGTIFKGFFSLIFLSGFIAYAMDFGKRVFK